MLKLSIRDLALTGQRVFVRVDFNVPLDASGGVADDSRLHASLPTIQHARSLGATVVLASHLGRPKGRIERRYSLRPIADRVARLLAQPISFAENCVGDAARLAVERAHSRGAESRVVLLENLRFHPGEEQNDPGFAQQLASLTELYVNDAFAAAHRAHASVEGITHYMPSAAAGLLMERELQYLGRVVTSPDRPLVVILGGAKVSDKLDVIQHLLPRLDRLIVGGAMAYTFLKARGVPVGRSLVEDDKLDSARQVEAKAAARGLRLELPVDLVVAEKLEADVPGEILDVGDIAIGDRMGVDIGPKTIARYGAVIKDARTVVWNGPMGVFENAHFAAGTHAVARAVAAVSGTTVVAGGDSTAAVRRAGVADRITHISTGGGASLEFLGGRPLPGVEALSEKPVASTATIESTPTQAK